VKHGVRIHAVNFYTGDVGNSEVPEKFRQLEERERSAFPKTGVKRAEDGGQIRRRGQRQQTPPRAR
jgi:hypothetical protein